MSRAAVRDMVATVITRSPVAKGDVFRAGGLLATRGKISVKYFAFLGTLKLFNSVL